jgi:hypothetical protein
MTVSDQEMNGNSAGYAVYTKQTPSGGGLTVTAAGSATSVAKGGTLQFSVSPAEAVTWSITTSGRHSGTTISTTGGLLTVAAAETQPSLEIKAESTADPSKSGTATVTVTGGGGGEGVTFGAVTYNSSSGNCSAPFTYTGGGTPSAEMLFATNANKATANPMGWDWNGDQWEDMTISGGTASLTGTTTSKAKYQSYAYVYVVIEVGSGLNAKQYWHQLKPAASGGS